MKDSAWMLDRTKRLAFVDHLLETSLNLATSEDQNLRVVGRFQEAVLPQMVEWLAGEVEHETRATDVLLAMNIGLAGMLLTLAKINLPDSAVSHFPRLAGQHQHGVGHQRRHQREADPAGRRQYRVRGHACSLGRLARIHPRRRAPRSRRPASIP